jgi:YVTN family beta-propeller protein
MILQIMGLAFVVILLSNNAFAENLHDRTLYEQVKQTYVKETSEFKKTSYVDVGERPLTIAVNNIAQTVYVANQDSDSVSVISAENNTKIKDIPVGDYPIAIAIDGDTDTVYVANSGSNSVSVIDGVTNKIVAGIMLNVNPFNSGYIECDRLISPTSQYFYVWSGAECIAKPNKGFEFLSWEENLKNNSAQVLKVSPSASPLDAIADFFNIKSDEPEAKLNITKFGSFTANFKELPAPVPTEYWTGLYTVVISSIVGWFIPGIVSSITRKRQLNNVGGFHKHITSLYDDKQLDKKDIESLDKIKRDISNAYSTGKIGNEHHDNLNNEISMLYQEVFKKEIDSLNSSTNNEDKIKLLNKIHSDIEDAYSKEKVTEKHYNLLKEKISDYENSHSINTS